MRRLIQPIIAVSVVAFALVTPSVGAQPASAGGQEHKNRYTDETSIKVCQDSQQGDAAGTITYTGPLKLWPPNHKYDHASVTWSDEDADDDLTVSFQATHDQYDGDTGTEENGSGNTADDITPAAGESIASKGSYTQAFDIRAERSGRFKEGRTYTISYQVTFTDSDGDDSSEDATTCTGDFTIAVPHDMRPGNR